MARLIPISQPFFSSNTKPPPPPPIAAAQISDHLPQIISRRDATVLLSSATSLLLTLSPTNPAFAFSLGISGPKEWLKDQKKKSSRFLLAPIDATRQALQSAYLSLTSESDYTEKDLENLQNLFKSSARDCVPKERSSLVDFQSKSGVEVCTFKLVVKNAASLLDDKDPVKLEAENILDDLVRSFGSLIVLTNGVDMNLPSDRKKVADGVTETISYLDKFEKGVKDCLEI
ncbi:hypothetical protein AtNW77_Chr5g0125531 [Arabidopsis thaliana]|jgi:hypothetical protein|uniref:Uncharacterized protein n=4 Tax=Arabidopsis TaxID=3701 RepID=A0A178UII7_ARATH|nr:plasma membrane fusion protein [Arabidopsis thaliana]KAG7604676.1 hypothetical protein ISN45_At05g037450 [Arabidopsis thaliana x Arabidopsis arenosa]KAG7611608.1 hypothetical protein ISN44_As05g037010 [Arabidopsis suecica]AED94859.1 plasma membrane fusion protein [Arabidopsis thaliana]OAO92481.1 hypothetical protein AXX17_AT5G40660 [Arabidopsis thaliana]CAA0407076.1 unnamed protein product [Arabidopsis thaliana]|eukprot:NP_568612.1 plasma membrane fusion protein [Arabidopsis thaliana]